jgi:FPC/CPF motif-containing protein YcgG
MSKTRKKYKIAQLVSAVFMILALFWLTVSAPFVYSCMQNIAKQDKSTQATSNIADNNEEETANPFGNSTEEKAAGGINSFSEEYLHDHHVTDDFFSIVAQYHKCEDAGTYVAFHGELLVPPPNAA